MLTFLLGLLAGVLASIAAVYLAIWWDSRNWPADDWE